MNRKSNIENLNRLRNMNERIENDIRDAKRLTSQGVQSYNKGWADEDNEDWASASQRFNSAHSSISQASRLLPLNQSLKMLSNTINFKIEGNGLFNEGNQLLDEANLWREKACQSIELGDIRQAEECLKKSKERLQEARLKFDEGYRLSKDDRFLTCTQIVDETLGPLNSAFKSISDQLDANLNFNVAPTANQTSSSRRKDNNTFFQK